MAYVPQLTPTSPTNVYTDDIYYAWNPFYQTGYGLPNCTAYAFGRFWSLANPTSATDNKPRLKTSYSANACFWWGYTEDGYERGQTAKLGAVICFYTDGDFEPGHVGIVEEIHDDGSITTSNSAWGGSIFYLERLYPPYTSYYHDEYGNLKILKCQGFIYNPFADGGGGKLPTWLLAKTLLRRRKDVKGKTLFGSTRKL